MPRNTIQWTLSTHPKDVFYTPLEAAPDDEEAAKARAEREGRVMERSLRETRMKKGPTIGALHQ
jgi:ribosome-binding factor A